MDKTIEYQLNIIPCVRRMNKKELMKMVGNHKEIVNQYLEGKVSEEELKNTIGLYQTYIVNTYKGQFSCQGKTELIHRITESMEDGNKSMGDCILKDLGLSMDCASHGGTFQEFQEMLYLKEVMGVHITYDVYRYIANKLKESDMSIREMEVSELYELANNYMKIFCSDKIYLLGK